MRGASPARPAGGVGCAAAGGGERVSRGVWVAGGAAVHRDQGERARCGCRACHPFAELITDRAEGVEGVVWGFGTPPDTRGPPPPASRSGGLRLRGLSGGGCREQCGTLAHPQHQDPRAITELRLLPETSQNKGNGKPWPTCRVNIIWVHSFIFIVSFTAYSLSISSVQVTALGWESNDCGEGA